MILTLHMPLVAAGRQGYRNSLCFQGCLRRGTGSHVLRAAWHQLLDGCEIGWTEKPVWMWPEPLTSVMVLCSDMTIVWVGTVFDMDPSQQMPPIQTGRMGDRDEKFTYGLKWIVQPKKKKNVSHISSLNFWWYAVIFCHGEKKTQNFWRIFTEINALHHINVTKWRMKNEIQDKISKFLSSVCEI